MHIKVLFQSQFSWRRKSHSSWEGHKECPEWFKEWEKFGGKLRGKRKPAILLSWGCRSRFLVAGQPVWMKKYWSSVLPSWHLFSHKDINSHYVIGAPSRVTVLTLEHVLWPSACLLPRFFSSFFKCSYFFGLFLPSDIEMIDFTACSGVRREPALTSVVSSSVSGEVRLRTCRPSLQTLVPSAGHASSDSLDLH